MKRKKLTIRQKLELLKEVAQQNEQRRKEFKKKSQLKGNNSTDNSTRS